MAQKTCLILLELVCLVWLAGCANFFAEKPTEIQAENILRNLSRIKVLPDVNVVEPEIYAQKPRIVVERDCAKLYYNSRYHTVPVISAIVQQQFPTPPPPALPSFQVSQMPATNQIIVRCPTVEDANAVLAFLSEVDVKPIQVHIDCIVSEIYADVTMDWESTLQIQNLFGEQITLGGKEVPVRNPITGAKEGTEVLPAFPGASLRDSARSQIGLKVGINRGVEGHKFLALLDMLVSKGYLKILMSPSLEVVNGKSAKIMASDHVPLPKEYITQLGVAYTTTEYQDVIDSLQVTPQVFADGYIGLETKVEIGSKSTPEGVKQISILTKREIQNAENRIRQGESLVIGGLKKTEKRSVIRGVPFLKDIPVIGIFFSSKDFEERGKEILFILTPTLSSGGVDQARMAEELIRKHEFGKYEGTWRESLLDPLGFQSKAEEKLKLQAQAENDRINAERAKARAEKAEAEAKHLKELAEEANIEKDKAEQFKAQAAMKASEAEKARAQAAAAEADAKKAAAEAEKAKTEADRAKAQAAAQEAAKAAAEAQKRAAEAEKAKSEADRAAALSREMTAKADAEKARAAAEAAKAQSEAEKARAEADRAAAEAEKERARIEALRSAATKQGSEANEANSSILQEPDRSEPEGSDPNR